MEFQDLPDFSEDYKSPDEDVRVLTVKELDDDDQPRVRAKKYGISSLSNAELFALILRVGTRGYPITTLCRDLMKRNENLIGNLERNTLDQLMEIPGVGELKAYQVMAVMEIVRRYGRERVGDRVKISSSSDIYNIMRHEIGNLAYEEMWVIFLNRGNKVIGKMRISSGSSVGTVFDVKKILKNALLAHAEGVALCHNHPSGTLMPSAPDDQVTRKLKSACQQLDLNMLDHVIVTADGYYSYADQARL